jgi:putative endonuclease
MSRVYSVYILASASHELYVGVTNNLGRRLHEHRNGSDPNSYTRRRHITRLVYYEQTSDVRAAIAREKAIKFLKRRDKLLLIEGMNPDWVDLADG